MQLSEIQLWDMVESFDWQNICQNGSTFTRLSKEALTRFSDAELKALREFVMAKRNELSTAWRAYERDNPEVELGCSGDGFHDLLCHIVGLGEAAHKAALSDPRLILARASANEYEENFLYVVPTANDRQSLQATYYTEAAQRYLTSLAEVEVKDTDARECIEILRRALAKFSGSKPQFSPEEVVAVSTSNRQLLAQRVQLEFHYAYGNLVSDYASISHLVEGDFQVFDVEEPQRAPKPLSSEIPIMPEFQRGSNTEQWEEWAHNNPAIVEWLWQNAEKLKSRLEA